MAKKAVKKKDATAKPETSAPKRAKASPVDQTASEGSQQSAGGSGLTADQLVHFRALLLEKLEEITGDVDHLESGSLKSSRGDASGDLSSMPIHMADIGSDNYEQEFALGLMSSERKIVQEIIAALKRIEDGTYGICQGTGEPIPLPRLNGIPWARYCVQYAEKLEKGLVRPPSQDSGASHGASSQDDEEREQESALDEDEQE